MTSPSPAAAPVAPRADVVWRRGVFVLVAAYVAARLVVLLQGRPVTSWDSFSYAHTEAFAYDPRPLVSLTGAAPRLWGTPLFFALFPDDEWRVVGQWVVATAAWAALAVVVWGLGRRRVTRVVGAVAVLVLALLDPVSTLDLGIMSDSLSVSLGVLTVALLVRWLTAGSRVAVVGMTIAAFWWTFTRPDIRVFTVVLIAALAVVAWRLPARRVAAIAAGAVLVAAVGWCSAIVPVTQRHFGGYSATAQSLSEEVFLYRVDLDVLPRPRAREFFVEQLGMPLCAGASEAAATDPWNTPAFTRAYFACPGMTDWDARRHDDAFTQFARRDPAGYLALAADVANRDLVGDTYVPGLPRVLPHLVGKIGYPGLPWSLPVTAAALLLLAGLAFIRAREGAGAALWAGVGAATASVVSLAATVAVAQGFWRLGIQESIGLRVGMIFLLVAALDGVSARVAERQVQPEHV